jgi:hypothetical protein
MTCQTYRLADTLEGLYHRNKSQRCISGADMIPDVSPHLFLVDGGHIISTKKVTTLYWIYR